jgi:hypothetical protein
MLGTQHDSVLEAAEVILAAGGRVVAGLVHNPYYGEINPDSVEPVGRMLFEYEGRFALLAAVRGRFLYDVWSTARGATRIVAEAERLCGRRITDALLGYFLWPAASLTCARLASLILDRNGELVVVEGSGVAAVATRSGRSTYRHRASPFSERPAGGVGTSRASRACRWRAHCSPGDGVAR